jgi:hypothetical protein
MGLDRQQIAVVEEWVWAEQVLELEQVVEIAQRGRTGSKMKMMMGWELTFLQGPTEILLVLQQVPWLVAVVVVVVDAWMYIRHMDSTAETKRPFDFANNPFAVVAVVDIQEYHQTVVFVAAALAVAAMVVDIVHVDVDTAGVVEAMGSSVVGNDCFHLSP